MLPVCQRGGRQRTLDDVHEQCKAGQSDRLRGISRVPIGPNLPTARSSLSRSSALRYRQRARLQCSEQAKYLSPACLYRLARFGTKVRKPPGPGQGGSGWPGDPGRLRDSGGACGVEYLGRDSNRSRAARASQQ